MKDRRFAAAWAMAVQVGQQDVQAGLIAHAAQPYEPDELPGDEALVLPPMSVGERLAVVKLTLARAGAGAGAGVGTGEAAPFALADGASWEMIQRRGEEAKMNILIKLSRVRRQIMAKRREAGGLEIGRLVMEPGWVWQGEGDPPPLPGQEDNQGWDKLEASVAAWRERISRGVYDFHTKTD